MTSRWFTCTINNFPGQAQEFLEQFY